MGVAGGEGCRDERRGSSASEVGTVDGTAKKKKKKSHKTVSTDHNFGSERRAEGQRLLGQDTICKFSR